MFGAAWLTLRQVQAALRNGQLDEARRLLGQPAVQGHRRAWELYAQLAADYRGRGDFRLSQNDPAGAWDDLVAAEACAPAVDGIAALRQALTARGLGEIRAALDAGEPTRAAGEIARLRERKVPDAELQPLDDAARDWVLTAELADRGELPLALQMFERVERAAPGPGAEKYRAELERRRDGFQEYAPQLHAALDGKNWREVLQLADRVLEVAPQHGAAKQARTKAWRSHEPETVALPREAMPPPPPPDEPPGPPRRFLLWIDGVGGYLVCLTPRVTLGQVGLDNSTDVPLLADVSRLHASIQRDAEGYVIESARPLQLNGQPTQKSPLSPGDRITLGAGCQLIFRKPVPLSATARLELESGQRLPLSLDGVILMAETLVIGPGEQSHIAMDLARPVVIFRGKDGLGVRYEGDFTVNGQASTGRANLPPAASVAGREFSFSVEPVKRI